ncbi:hypothetical protein [Alkalilimnicola ehrlichii]|uniref:hypothetical protein n=1 Tax=Alkalilimnicola ehrlichii TaxID=351052 RepID=UPI0026CA567E|nr:hypothetical protein [Alkalilimnicola ehrlichii]
MWGHAAPLAQSAPPEVQREDLTDFTLAAAVAGYRPEALSFPEPLPEQSLYAAQSLLCAFGALDEAGEITERGRGLFALPVDTALAHLISAMPTPESKGFMADLVAALSVRQSLATPPKDPALRARLCDSLGRRCDATLLVAAIRGLDLVDIDVHKRVRDEARHVASQLRDLLGLPVMPQGLNGEAETAFAHAAEAAPNMVFVRREKRRQAFANGSGELKLGERSLLTMADEAALVFDTYSVPGRGTRETMTLGTCLAPLPIGLLPSLGLGERVEAESRLDEDGLRVRQVLRFSGRELGETWIEPVGEQARAALAKHILVGELLPPAGSRLQDDLEAWELYCRLGEGEGEVPEPLLWLQERLRALGVDRAADMELIEPEDLRFEGIPDWERARFDEHYPRRISLSDLELKVSYQLRRRRVTLEYLGGRRKDGPRRWELPAWSGWQVEYKKASKSIVL